MNAANTSDVLTDDGEALVFSTVEGELHAVDTDTGDTRWGPVPEGLGGLDDPGRVGGPVAASDEVLVAADAAGGGYALDPDSGEPRWLVELDAEAVADVLVADDVAVFVYLPQRGVDGQAAGVDLADGEVRWEVALGRVEEFGLAEHALVHDDLFVQGYETEAVGHDLATGEERWRVDYVAEPVGTRPPLVLDEARGDAYAIDRLSTAISLPGGDSRLVRTNPMLQPSFATLADDGALFVQTSESLQRLD